MKDARTLSLADISSYASSSLNPLRMHCSRRWSSSFIIMDMDTSSSPLISTAEVRFVFKRLGEMRWFSTRACALAPSMESM